MSRLGAVEIGPSVAFALFMVVLLLELGYVYWWRRRRQKRRLAVVQLQGAGDHSASHERSWAKRVLWKWEAWRKLVLCAGCSRHRSQKISAEPHLQQSATLLMWWRTTPSRSCKLGASDAAAGEEKGCKIGKQEAKGEEELEEGEDVLQIAGLWGPPRFLFTIMEETKEEMEEQLAQLQEEEEGEVIITGSGSGSIEAAVSAGKSSRRASRASSELLCFSTVASSSSRFTSPFVTPPSSPPFATPFGSPAPCHLFDTAAALARANAAAVGVVEVKSTASCSNSTSSSSPAAQLGAAVPSLRPLSVVFADTSSFSPSSSSSLSPPSSNCSAAPLIQSSSSIVSDFPENRRQHHPLCFLLDPPPSPSSALYLYQSRVHPLCNSTCGNNNVVAKPIRGSQVPNSQARAETRGIPFNIPAPSRPTTPCPFRPSLHGKQSLPSAALVMYPHFASRKV